MALADHDGAPAAPPSRAHVGGGANTAAEWDTECDAFDTIRFAAPHSARRVATAAAQRGAAERGAARLPAVSEMEQFTHACGGAPLWRRAQKRQQGVTVAGDATRLRSARNALVVARAYWPPRLCGRLLSRSR